MVGGWYTAEDDRQGRPTSHVRLSPGAPDERVCVEIPVRVPWWMRDRVQLVIRGE